MPGLVEYLAVLEFRRKLIDTWSEGSIVALVKPFNCGAEELEGEGCCFQLDGA